MGKYDSILKIFSKNESQGKFDIQVAIANELAEQNRLKRLELEMEYKGRALRNLHKVLEDGKGHKMYIPPDDKAKENYKEEFKAIEKELEDKA